MSAVVKCTTKMKHRRDLLSGLRLMGVPTERITFSVPGNEPVMHRGYKATDAESVDIRIDRDWHGGYGDISFKSEGGVFTMIGDDMDENKWNAAVNGTFRELVAQYYAAAAAERALELEGFTTTVAREGDRVQVRARAY